MSVRQNIATGARKVLMSAERLGKTIGAEGGVLGKVSPSRETTCLTLGIFFVEVYSGGLLVTRRPRSDLVHI